jgi:uncharacterized protein (DUF1800 family)
MSDPSPAAAPLAGSAPPRRAFLEAAALFATAPLAGLVAGCAPLPVTNRREPAAPTGGSAPAAPGALTLAPDDLALVNRITWGASATTAADFNRAGRAGWLRSQLHPGGGAMPAEAEAFIASLSISKTPFETLVADMDAMRIDSDARARQAVDSADKQAARQAYQQALTKVARDAASRSLMRALYSSNQLQEQMTWFWFNHFNVHQYKGNLRVLVGDYEDKALRPRALGRFRDLLIASATHPAMLRYLDNEQNAAGRINENYAREVMELHTLGVDGGYSQKDVQELARVLTGVGVNFSDKTPTLRPNLRDLYVRQGFVEFNPGRHDMGEKVVLDQRIAGTGWKEVLDELGRLANHPSTAHFVSRKLAQYFAADAPPPSLVERMTLAFGRSDGDIALTLAAMFDAPEFGATLGRKFKDPMHFVVSAVRLAYDDRIIPNPLPMAGWLGRLGELPYNRQTPDGYPLDESAWASPGQMATRFEIARAIGTGSAGLFRAEGGDVDVPAFPRLANAFFYDSIEPTLSPATRTALARATSPQEWNVFLLSSPEFMMR